MEKDKRHYRIYAFGIWCAIIYFVGGFLLPMGVMWVLPIEFNVIVFVVIALVLNVASFYAAKNIGLRPIDVSFDQEKISFSFLSRDLQRVKRSKEFYYGDVKEFYGGSDGRDEKFQLKFTNRRSFTLYKSHLWNREDDFEELVADLRSTI